MSIILDKSQIIHIVSVIIVLFGLTFYFTQKNNKLMGFINDLNKKIEDQENIIQKHEQMILKLINIVDTMDHKYNQYFTKLDSRIDNKKDPNVSSNLKNVFEPVNIQSIPSLIFEVSNNSKNNKMESSESKVEEIYENLNTDIEPDVNEIESETIDLDAELAEELSELS